MRGKYPYQKSTIVLSYIITLLSDALAHQGQMDCGESCPLVIQKSGRELGELHQCVAEHMADGHMDILDPAIVFRINDDHILRTLG